MLTLTWRCSLNIVLVEVAIPEYEDLSHRIADVFHLDVLLTSPVSPTTSILEESGMGGSLIFMKGDVQNEALLRRLYENQHLHSGIDVRSCVIEMLSVEGVD